MSTQAPIHRARGASMVEYALLLFAVVVVAAVAVKTLGPAVGQTANRAHAVFY